MKPTGHIWDLMDYLDELDGKTVNITLQQAKTAKAQADFDRQVRASLDRLHRRRHIAET